jgi:hypothetical protein
MAVRIEDTVAAWLTALKINVSKAYLSQQLQSHTDYPSMASITDTLDELSIENTAMVIDKDNFHQVPVPFLAHSDVEGGQFILITDVKKQFTDNPALSFDLDGICLLADNAKEWYHTENELWLAKQKRKKYTMLIGCIIAILLSIMAVFNRFSPVSIALFIISLSGLCVAILIVRHELGFSDKVVDDLCHVNKNTDCDIVINSNGSKLTAWFSFSDAGVIYFVSFLLLFIISFSGNVSEKSSLLPIFSAAIIPFTFFSLYYQKVIVKKWCTLCLLTVTILWLQFAFLFNDLVHFDLNIVPLSNLSFTVFLFTVVSLVWILVVKPALEKNKEFTERIYSLQRFKNDPEIFTTLLMEQRKVDVDPFEYDLQLGNATAPLQLMVACNPYCGPCAVAHEILHDMAEKNDIGLTVRFTVKVANTEDKKTKAVAAIIETCQSLQIETQQTGMDKKQELCGAIRQVIYNWFKWMNYDQFIKKYNPAKEINNSSILKFHEDWLKNNNIKRTPSLFINGYEMPKQYTISDFQKIVFSLNEKAKSEKFLTNNINKGPEAKLFIAQ